MVKRASPAGQCRCRHKPKVVPIEDVMESLIEKLAAFKRRHKLDTEPRSWSVPPLDNDDDIEDDDAPETIDPHAATIALLGQWNAKGGGA